jgi:hypothetical protein
MNNYIVTPNTIIQRNELQFLVSLLGEEIVMMNLETGDFVTMNNVGAQIWELSENPVPVSDLVKKLQEIYTIPQDQCLTETSEFLQQSANQKMFIIVNSDNGII